VSYTSHTPEEVRQMLARIGAAELEALFESVPERLRKTAQLRLPGPLSEYALLREFGALAARNASGDRYASFLGAGAYEHFIPAAVDALASRGEFLTAYTPYQAEVSQGTLQAIFEFQTLICQLTGLDVANASLYDGGAATAEAALVALRQTRRRRLLVSDGLHPNYRQVLATYTEGLGTQVDALPLAASGVTAPAQIPADTAAVLVQYPNFFGCVEDLEPWAKAAHQVGALLVVVTNEPLALALLRAPGDAGADLACGEAQSFGVPLGFGGPYAGFLSARQSLVRQLPGRMIGETTDADGRRCFVMTLTTREQHIRREKATSNVCTNQGLMALRVTIYLALLGRAGLRKLAGINLSLTEYAKRRLRERGVLLPHSAPTFNEFTVQVPGAAAKLAALEAQQVLGGYPLARLGTDHTDRVLICVTETRSREDIDRLAKGLAA
jgi:glycine dehydrogenase subunit 1